MQWLSWFLQLRLERHKLCNIVKISKFGERVFQTEIDHNIMLNLLLSHPLWMHKTMYWASSRFSNSFTSKIVSLFDWCKGMFARKRYQHQQQFCESAALEQFGEEGRSSVHCFKDLIAHVAGDQKTLSFVKLRWTAITILTMIISNPDQTAVDDMSLTSAPLSPRLPTYPWYPLLPVKPW